MMVAITRRKWAELDCFKASNYAVFLGGRRNTKNKFSVSNQKVCPFLNEHMALLLTLIGDLSGKAGERTACGTVKQHILLLRNIEKVFGYMARS